MPEAIFGKFNRLSILKQREKMVISIGTFVVFQLNTMYEISDPLGVCEFKITENRKSHYVLYTTKQRNHQTVIRNR